MLKKKLQSFFIYQRSLVAKFSDHPFTGKEEGKRKSEKVTEVKKKTKGKASQESDIRIYRQVKGNKKKCIGE